MKRAALGIGLIGALAHGEAPAAPAAPVATGFVACLQPIGPHEAWLVAPVGRGVEFVYGFTVRVLDPIALPDDAWYAPRKRWRAEKLLDHLLADVVPTAGCDAVIGLTSVDISTTKDEHADWGVLGLAYVDNQVAVVSSFRARHGASRRRIAMRTVKVVDHELGHVLGMPHGGAAGCIMNDAGGTVKTVDRESGELCADERAHVEGKLGVTLPGPRAVDWAVVLGR